MEQHIFLKGAVCAFGNVNALLAFPSLSYLSTAASTSTMKILLMHFYSGFIQHFSHSKLLHTGSDGRRYGSVFNGGREREGEKKGEGNLNWSLVNLETFFSRMLTWSDQKHPTGTDPCSHEGKPLMLLPWLPCWTRTTS